MDQEPVTQLVMSSLSPEIGVVVLAGLVFILLIMLIDEAFKGDKR